MKDNIVQPAVPSYPTYLVWRWLECLFIFFVLPLAMFLSPVRIPPMPALYVLLAYVFFFHLRHDTSFSWRTQIFTQVIKNGKWIPLSRPALVKELRRILVRFGLIGVAMTVLAWLWIPEYFLSLPRKYPALFPLVLILYPLFSVIPQGIVFRCFFVRRYAPLFANSKNPQLALWLVATLLFGWVHIVMGYWQSIGVAAIGGAMFYQTYFRSGSPFLANLEHALYGNLAFTLGYGVWLYYPLQQFS